MEAYNFPVVIGKMKKYVYLESKQTAKSSQAAANWQQASLALKSLTQH